MNTLATQFGGGAVAARALRFWCAGLGLALLPAGPALAQTPAWEVALNGGNNPTGTPGTSVATASAVDARGNVFITGIFDGTVSFGSIQLTSAGSDDVFVAKWDASAQVFTWATSAGGTDVDEGRSIAVSGTSVYVTGAFASNTNASIAGQALAGAGGIDLFVAKFVDTSTGTTPATSSFANAWATSGGGTGTDVGTDIAVNGANVYITGVFASNTNASIAGQALAGAGAQDVFVAKYADTSTGTTPATSSFANAWATSAGGIGGDVGRGIAVSGTGVYVTGDFTSNTNARIAGQALAGAGGDDVFVAKYVDTSTGNTPATSSFANAWATSGGGTGGDRGRGLAVSGSRIYTVGSATPPATFGSIRFGVSANGPSLFLAGLAAPVLATAHAVAPLLTLAPNPARGAARLTGIAPHAAVSVFDALGRPVAGATADAAGTAHLALPTGLAPGVYLVRSGLQVRRLVLE